MNAAAHQITRRFIDQTVTGDSVLAGEYGSDNIEFVVAAILGTRMTRMPVRFVLDGDGDWLQGRQPFPQSFDRAGAHAGRTFLNGLTVTFSYTPAAT